MLQEASNQSGCHWGREAARSLIFYSSGSAGDGRQRVCTARIMSCTNSQKFTFFFPVTHCSFFYRPRLWKFIFMCHLLPQGVEPAKNITISSPLITDYLCKGRIIILDILEDSPYSPQLPPAKVVLNDIFMKYSKGQYCQLQLNIEHESSEVRMLERLVKRRKLFCSCTGHWCESMKGTRLGQWGFCNQLPHSTLKKMKYDLYGVEYSSN